MRSNSRRRAEAGTLASLALLAAILPPALQAVDAAPRRIIDVEQAQKAKEAAESSPARLPLYPLRALGRAMERGLIRVENERLQERLGLWMQELALRGIEPGAGGLGEGAGFGLGVRLSNKDFWRKGFDAAIDLRGSAKLYQRYGLDLRAPLAVEGRAFLLANAQYALSPQEDFYGFGLDAARGDRASYNLQDRALSFGIGARPSQRTEAGISFGYHSARVFDGRNRTVLPLGQSAGASGLPGFGGAEHLSWGAWFTADLRDSTWDPKRGALVRLSATVNDGIDGQNLAWNHYGFEAQAFRPLLYKDQVLALRIRGDFNNPRGGGSLPFFRSARLGGRDSLRGYRPNRFHGANALALNLEYRYGVWPRFMDAILFLDAGQVAPKAGDLKLPRARADWGIGFKLKTLQSALVRFDTAFGPEGPRFYVTFSPAF